MDELIVKPKKKRKQTRRSISISKRVYDRLKAHCQSVDNTMSGFVENQIKKFLEAQDRAKAG